MPEEKRNKLHILFVSCEQVGHINPMIPWIRECVARGHKVTLATDPKRKNLVEGLDMYILPIKGMNSISEIKSRAKKGFIAKYYTLYTAFRDMAGNAYHILEQYVTDPKIGKVDVMVVDFFMPDGFDIADKYNIPVFNCYPNPVPVACNSIRFFGPPHRMIGFPYHMSLSQRITNFFFGFSNKVMNTMVMLGPNIRRRSRGLPSFSDGFPCPDKSSQYAVLSKTAYGFEWATYTAPHIHLVGITAPKSLPEVNTKLKQWLDQAKQTGQEVIYISFGSHAELSKSKLEILLKSLQTIIKDLKTRVVWSLRDKQRALLQGKDEKVRGLRVENWVKQHSLLAHPAVTLFISHGGSNSLHESILQKVPLVTLPQGADQFDNSARIMHSGIGLRAYGMGPKLVQAVKNVRSNPSVKRNMDRVYYLMTKAGGGKKVADILEDTAFLGGYDYLLPYENKVKPNPWITLGFNALLIGTGIGLLRVGLLIFGRKTAQLNVRDMTIILK
ncbi:hypothetical protein AAMO2058_001273300 [Amorphochlora amoebiformis]